MLDIDYTNILTIQQQFFYYFFYFLIFLSIVGEMWPKNRVLMSRGFPNFQT